MTDLTTLAQWAAAIICTVIVSLAVLKGWSGWLELKRLELTADRTLDAESPVGRISLADLKQRVRRLEAIAEVIDLPDARGQAGR